MPPYKQACELSIKVMKASYELNKRIVDNRLKLNRVSSAKIKQKFGILDAIGAEMISSIGALSAYVAGSIVGAISKTASTFIESVMYLLLQILLSAPTVVFSLVAIPLDRALKAVAEERIYLMRAQMNMNTIIQILSKWTVRVAGNEYYQQIKDSMWYLEQAINFIGEIVQGLSGPNAVFSESAYRRVHDNIQKAYDITKPFSMIDDRLGLTDKLESKRNDNLQKEKSKIDTRYMAQMNKLKDWYTKDPDKFRNEYSAQTVILETKWKEELHDADLKASYQAIIDKGIYYKAAGGAKAEFASDMQALSIAVSDLYNNMKKAYERYLEYHNLCNTIYNIRTVIKALISELVEMIRMAGNAAGKPLIGTLNNARAMLQATYNSFDKMAIKNTKMEMASRLSSGHIAIGAADSMMHARITNSLIALINADDVLESGAEEFDEFIKRLYNIPDWDGKIGVWAVDLVGCTTPPYIQLIADSFDLLTKVFSGEAPEKIYEMNGRYRKLLNHNGYVGDVLNSYHPYRASEVVDLTNILSNAGLLQEFTQTLSILNLTSVVASSFSDGVSDMVPSLKNCKRSYPELYKDRDTIETYLMMGIGFSTHHYCNTAMSNIEDKRMSDMARSIRFKCFDIPGMINPKKDLISRPL